MCVLRARGPEGSCSISNCRVPRRGLKSPFFCFFTGVVLRSLSSPVSDPGTAAGGIGGIPAKKTEDYPVLVMIGRGLCHASLREGEFSFLFFFPLFFLSRMGAGWACETGIFRCL